MKRLFHIPGLAICAFGLTAAAHAESVAVRAIGSLAKAEGQEIPVSLRIKRALNFGEVRIPNGRIPGSVCRYELGTFRFPFRATYTEFAQGERQGVIDTPTPSGCAWDVVDASGNGGLGVVEVACDPLRELNVALTFASAAPGGVRYSPTFSGIAVTLDPSSPDAFTERYDATSFTSVCPAQDEARLNGALEIHVGGILTVREEALASSGETDFGQITVDVSY